ncbi:alpha/beta fold hydrolase [Streptomyces sp. NPDC050095]|uniref:thioesterase II family protein n=1 Tax=unclassified Streptomyces TaxID=2593676 RepID=UPI003426EA48
MNSTWFRRFTTPAGDGPRLVCFPHAGGSATAYRPLALALADDFDVVAVQYPGRQDRYDEEAFTAVAPLAEAVAAELAADRGRPYALFGHSMGALVAFETAMRLARDELPAPQRLFLSGRSGPAVRDKVRYDLFDDAAILNDVADLGGTDRDLLDDPEIQEMVLPALRGDYRAFGSYRWGGGEPLAVPMTVLVGDDDPMVTLTAAESWREHTTGDFDLRVFPGGHFYLFDRVAEVAHVVRDGLLAGTTAP